MSPVWGLSSWMGASEGGVRSLRGWVRAAAQIGGSRSSPRGGTAPSAKRGLVGVGVDELELPGGDEDLLSLTMSPPHMQEGPGPRRETRPPGLGKRHCHPEVGSHEDHGVERSGRVS